MNVSNKTKLMNKKIVTLLCSLFLLSGCSGLFESGKTDDISSVTDEEGKISEPLDINTDVLNNPDTKYDPSVLLVKTSATSDSDDLTDDMKNLGIKSIKSIAPRSEWKKATLKEGIDALSVIKKFRNSGLFDMVDFDYIYDTEEVKEETTVTTSTIPTEIADYQKQVNVDKAWKYLEDNGKTAGGDSSVIVAVIDTGVDYNHIDLKQNIWINKLEIPGNGIDDDDNGYVDDVNGWNFVGNNNDPMDDNGHGTHVAGIIGAANNDIGVTGVAYNCKIMPIKAGNSSGYFNNSDIASAITYAYMNGADVINMSFGGTSVTMAVQEALEKAYSTSFLVAAAGNDGMPNEPYPTPSSPYETVYPASYSFVDGVMSVNGSNYGSVFTNFDPIKENKIEYECFAPGENISSTFPGNRYASLSGTSMATPVVSGIAALLRSAVPEKKDFPSKFLMSQIINTSKTQPLFNYWNGKAMVVDAYKALTEAPKPDVSLYDWYTFDNKSISSKNNGDDNIDAGETVHIGVELMNRGGMAKDVTATIDVKRLADDIVDPYVTITTPTVKFSDIGTYSVRDAGKKMESDTVVDVENPFVFDVAENAPNNYQCDINIHVTWKNGLTSKDTTLYSFDDVMSVTFHRGEVLPARIDTDTTLTADKLWIVNDTVRIGEGVTVTVEPGTNIQFYERNQSKYQYATPKILLASGASFICNGTEDKMINIYPADGYEHYALYFDFEQIINQKDSQILFNYVDIQNPITEYTGYDGYIDFQSENMLINIYNSNLSYDSVPDGNLGSIKEGKMESCQSSYLLYSIMSNSMMDFEVMSYNTYIIGKKCTDCSFVFRETSDYNPYSYFRFLGEALRNVFFFDTRMDDSSINLDRCSIFNGNAFVNNCINNVVLANYCKITYAYGNDQIPKLNDNHFYGYPKPIENRIIDSKLTNVVSGTGSISSVWPFVSGYQFTNDKGEETTKFSKENMNLKLYFNRAMDTTDSLSVKFGSVEPYADYIIDGTWIDEYTWQAKREIPTAIENGTQHLTVSGGRAKDDHFLTNNDNCHRISFDIDTTSAMAMNMFATPTKDGIQLEMKQDDYDTVMGYNVYRSETKDGEYARINTSVIRPEDAEQNATYLDTTIEPGKTYYYSYTAVMTDFSESHASGRTACTALDTINPIISHTPVNQGYLGSNLNINCVIRDNVGIVYAKLYYRVKGSETYKYVNMVSANDKYSGVIPAVELSTDGMEYYIETNDGVNTITLGTKESPYQVIIKESSAVSYLGDVDGNGIIEAVDAMLVLQHINGKRVLVNDEFRRGDLNDNGTLESFEALAILQYVNGNRTNLEV